MSIKAKALQFKKTYNLTDPTYNSLYEALSTLGYSIVEYGATSTASAKAMISVYGLERYTENRSFTFTDNFNKLIFIDSALSEKDKLISLAHEAGHIACGHNIDATASDNKDADLFSDYLLGLRTGVKTKVLVGIELVIVIILVAVLTGWLNSYYGDYYVTEFGEKYHLKDCMYVENAEHPRRFTVADYYSGKYEPCQVCEPEGEKD